MKTGNAVAMVLAAGRGERMRPLTDRTPKALLKVGGKPLIFWQLERLSRAGFQSIVVNHAHLGEQIVDAIGNGSRWNVAVKFSAESQALETAGGIANALPLLGAEIFAVINADVYTEFDFSILRRRAGEMGRQPGCLAHLVLVDNPAQHPAGDFALSGGYVREQETQRMTFSGLGVYRAVLFKEIARGSAQSLAPLLRTAIARRQVTGEYYRGRWFDVGTPERLHALDTLLAKGHT